MSIGQYWPSKANVDDCIHTVAEELPEPLLLAIHEPTKLEHNTASGERTPRSESELLNHLLESERPLPIVGRSGVGKSHVIRWLDANLRMHPETKDWRIIRIPKNASLRKTLKLMISDVEGAEFDVIREKLETISEEHSLEKVTLFLIAQAHYELNEFHRHPEKLGKFIDLKSLCAPANLPSLVNDDHFSKQCFLNENSPLRKVAERIMSGRPLDDIAFEDYQYSADDFDPSGKLVIQNLAIGARQFYRQKRLATNEGARQKAVRLLNLAIHQGSQNLVGNLLQLGAGGFTELFESIRKELLQKNMKLCLLVEDMTAISAIEQVLIDSLLQESLREGQRELCELRSAFAVTDGYQGYTMRRDTIITRSNGEWRISEKISNDAEFLQRMESFISRYLNAARFGLNKLNEMPYGSVDTWEDGEDPQQEIDHFGRAINTNVALFPFNRSSIKFFAEKYCVEEGTEDREFRFIPRDIIRDIILGVLKFDRSSFERAEFPPENFMSAVSSNSLRRQLKEAIPDEWSRADVVSRIWGDGEICESIEELRRHLPVGIATAFGFNQFPEILDANYQPPVVPGPEPEPEPEPEPGSKPLPDELKKIQQTVESWFKADGKPLPQQLGSALRKELGTLIKNFVETSWFGYGLSEIKIPTDGSQLSIHLPKSGRMTQDKRAIWFCSDEEFADQEITLLLQPVAIALLRNNYYREKLDQEDWHYESGWKDQALVLNFAAEWVPTVVSKLISKERESLRDRLIEHWNLALQLGLVNSQDSLAPNLQVLLAPSKEIGKKFSTPVTEPLQAIRDSVLSSWDRAQSNWLKLVSPSRRGLEYRLVKDQFEHLKDLCVSVQVLQKYQEPFQQIDGASEAVAYLSGEDEPIADDIREIISLIIETAELVREESYWPSGFELKSRSFIRRSQGLLESPSTVPTIKQLNTWRGVNDTGKIKLANSLDGESVNEIHFLLSTWKIIFSEVTRELETKRTPEETDLQTTKDDISALLIEVGNELSKLKGITDE